MRKESLNLVCQSYSNSCSNRSQTPVFNLKLAQDTKTAYVKRLCLDSGIAQSYLCFLFAYSERGTNLIKTWRLFLQILLQNWSSGPVGCCLNILATKQFRENKTGISALVPRSPAVILYLQVFKTLPDNYKLSVSLSCVWFILLIKMLLFNWYVFNCQRPRLTMG